MANFPTLTPNTREFSLGDFPQLVYANAAGSNVRFLQNNARRVTQTLQLSFIALTETQANLISTHYAGQQGMLVPFDLPSSVWSGFDSVPVSSSEYQWRYAEPYVLEQSPSPSRFNIQVTLVSEVV